MQDGWEHLPHDLLVAVVKHLGPEDARSMHRVCQSWHLAVRCGLQGMKPSPKLTPFPDIRDYFPRVRIRPAEDTSEHAVQRALSARVLEIGQLRHTSVKPWPQMTKESAVRHCVFATYVCTAAATMHNTP